MKMMKPTAPRNLHRMTDRQNRQTLSFFIVRLLSENLIITQIPGNANRALSDGNVQREEVKRMRDNIGDLRGKLADLENKNAQLEKELQNLNYQVSFFENSLNFSELIFDLIEI